MNNNGLKDKTPIVAYEEAYTIIYPSLHDAGKAYGMSTTQIKRLIENEQNVPHTRTFLDYALPGPDLPTPVILLEQTKRGFFKKTSGKKAEMVK